LMKESNVYVSPRGNAFRVSVNVFNTEADLWKLVEIIRLCLKV
jgi:hypothetical protein